MQFELSDATLLLVEDFGFNSIDLGLKIEVGGYKIGDLGIENRGRRVQNRGPGGEVGIRG